MDDPDSDDEECDENDRGDGKPPSGSQSNHNFNDGTDFYCRKTFENKEYLKGQRQRKFRGQFSWISIVNQAIGSVGKAGVITKNMVRGTLEHGYAWLLAYSYMVENLYPGSRICISLDDADRFKYYFVDYGACIRGYKHMRKVVAIDGTHLYGKYKGVLLSTIAHDTENHIYPIAFCVVDKECDESWTYFFEQLRYIIADEPDLCIISDRHKSIANGVSRIFEHAHHGLCMKHLAKVYGYQEFNEHFQQLRDKCPEAANCLEFDIGFDKWSKVYFPVNRYDVLTTNIAESLNSMLRDEREYPVTALFTSISRRFDEIFRQRCAYISSSINLFVPSAEKTLREKMNEDDSLFINNIKGDANEFTVFGSGLTAKVNS
ncbi:uncharacterized protein LOC132039488 [Lycium ferocissimum]|uniref:uncharacterized protein LOC132039488 n=1 Tax=Lycium ferocissimum TaxID=112874 RepID=UPI00281574FB|nr:uncharacterized protein LOC132039488 [Lycium ferocissimum]